MSQKPIIGITLESRRNADDARTMGEMKLNWNYAQAISDAGGVPLIIPPTADMDSVAELLDGWLIPGGADIDASRFGQENHPKVELQDPARYDSESRLYDSIDPAMPVLGICYGCQFLNVKRGGTLAQHLPDLVGEDYHSGGTLDEAKLDPGSKLSEIMGESVFGKSFHHQAVDAVGQGLEVVGRHADGTVEAIEAKDHPWMLGVQWHPERTMDDPATRRLFENFVSAAAAFQARKRDRVSA